MIRRVLITLLVLAVLVVAGWFGYQRYLTVVEAQTAEPNFETQAVQRGSIASTVSATGSIEPEARVSLTFRTPGRVDQVLATAGQAVAAGQLLAQLDTADLALAWEQADISLQISRAQLGKLEKPPESDDLAAAQAAVTVAQASIAGAESTLASAQASYRQLLAGPSELELAVQRAQVRQTEAQVRQAQSAYDQVRHLPNVGALPQSVQLEQATVNYEIAQAQYQLATEPAADAQKAAALNQIAQAQVGLRQAQANLVNAQNNLKKLMEGPGEEDLEIARAQVRQAELSKQQTENNLQNAQLVAPFSGVVSQVNIRQGEIASGALPAIVLTDLGSFHLKVLVDEIDVRQIQVGQAARITLDALPDTDIPGRVTQIDPTASDIGGVVAYQVEIVPDASEAPLRAGMSATAIITTAQVDNVVLVPNRYVQLDRQSGRAYVQKVVDGQPVPQEIEIGLRNERESQVLAGLADGDTIALVRLSSEEQLRNTFFGGN